MVANSSNGRDASSQTWGPGFSSKARTKAQEHTHHIAHSKNPVIESSEFILSVSLVIHYGVIPADSNQRTSIVTLDSEGIENAARYVRQLLRCLST